MRLEEVYRELVRLIGRRVCPVEDWHRSRWRIVLEPKTRRLELVQRDLTEDPPVR
mgnify:FL=1